MHRRSLLLAFPLSCLFVAVMAAQPAQTVAAQAPQTSAPSVDDLVARNLQAKGGAERIAAVRTIKQTARMSSMGMDADIRIFAKRPNLMRQELEGGGMTMVMAFDGTTAWGLNPNLGPSPAALSGENAAMIREQADLDGPLVDYKTKGNTVEYLGAETVGGRRLHHLRITSPTKRVTDCYLDAETGLEARIVTQTPRGEMVQELSDYRDVDGLKFPFKVTSRVGGVQTVAIEITRIEINPQIDDAIFKMGGGVRRPGL